MTYFDIDIIPYSEVIKLSEDLGKDDKIQKSDNYSKNAILKIRRQMVKAIKPLAKKIRELDYIEYSNPDTSANKIERGLSAYIDFAIKCDQSVSAEDKNRIYKYSIRFSEHKDKHKKGKNRIPVGAENKTLSDLPKDGWSEFVAKLPEIQERIRTYEIEKFGEQKTFITDPKPKEETTTNTTNNDSTKQESFKLKIKETNEKGCLTMKLMVGEDFENAYSNDMFSVLKDYLAKEFNPSRWDDLIYDFNEIPFDTGWFAEIIFTDTFTGQRIKFTAEYEDAYDGILYGTYNYGKESTFYSQKEYVDWLAEQVEWRLY